MCDYLLSLGSVPHTHISVIVTGSQCGLVVWVVANRAETRHVVHIHVAQSSFMDATDITTPDVYLSLAMHAISCTGKWSVKPTLRITLL